MESVSHSSHFNTCTRIWFVGVRNIIPLYTADKAHYSPIDISFAITGGGIFGAIFQVFSFDKFMKYFEELTFITYALLYSAIILLALTFMHNYWSIMIISFIVFIGFDMIRPAITNYFSNIAGNRQGFAGGLNSTFTSMGNFIGPLVAGTLYDINFEFPLYMAILVMFIGMIVIFIEKSIRNRLKNHKINNADKLRCLKRNAIYDMRK